MIRDISVAGIIVIIIFVFISDHSSQLRGKRREPSNSGPTLMLGSAVSQVLDALGSYVSTRSASVRLVVGRRSGIPIVLPSNDSLIVFGPTRSGKTTSLVLPLLSQFKGPVVVTSVKDDVYKASKTYRESLGQCHLFDLSSDNSSSWNIFSYISDFPSSKAMSDVLCRVGKNRGGEIEFWSQLASKILSPLILAAKESAPSLRMVFDWIELQDFDEPLDQLYLSGQIEAHSALEAMVKMDSRTLTSVIATLLSVLDPYSDPVVSRLLSTDGIEIESTLTRGQCNTLYLCAPMFRSERFAAIYEIFLNKVFEFAYGAGAANGKILFLLDELANVAPISDLDKIASTCGSFGVVLCSVFQDLSQVETSYGSRSRSVVNNHRSKLCLSGITDVATIDYINKIAARGNDVRTGSDYLQELHLGQGLLVRGTRRPMKVYLKPVPRRAL